MALKETTTRWDESAHARILAAAEACGGISFAQFVREAALMRAVLVLGEQRLPPETEPQLVRAVSDEVRRLAALDDC